MRDYAKVAPQFWTGKTGRALKAAGPEAVIVGLYLMTSPHANMIGVYYCPIEYIALDTGLGIEGASKGLQSAIEADFCTFEADSGYVFVHEFAAYQIGDELDIKDLRCKGVRNELAKVPKGQCWQSFRSRYAGPYHLPQPVDNSQITEAPSKPLRSQEQEQEQKQEEDMAKTDPGYSPPSPTSKPASANSDQTSLPDECPHRQILALWAEYVPMARQPRDWTPARQALLRSRWRESAKRQSLDWWREFFAYVARSKFLTGQSNSPGRKPFEIGLEWLLKPENFAKVREGAYHDATEVEVAA